MKRENIRYGLMVVVVVVKQFIWLYRKAPQNERTENDMVGEIGKMNIFLLRSSLITNERTNNKRKGENINLS